MWCSSSWTTSDGPISDAISTFHKTPNIDALAKSGALFTDAYAGSPVCSPTRASILTGKYPSRIGMSYLAGVKGPYGKAYMLDPPPVVGNIAPEDTTIAEALHSAGYATAHVGKWHLQGHGEKGTDNFPDKHGFEINIGGQNAGQPGSYHFPYKSKQDPGSGTNHPACNLPLRAGKAWLYEGGIRVPLLISYPQKIKTGQRLSEPVVSTDLFPASSGSPACH